MSTRATITFKDQWDTFYVYRGHDGFPSVILPDLEKAIKETKGRWSGSELGQLISYFMGITFDSNSRIQHYELTTAIHGDESYLYTVTWNEELKVYEITHH